MKKIIIGILLLTAFTLNFLVAQTAQEIVDRADASFKVERVYSTSSMTVYKSGEAQPVQEIESYTMEQYR